MRQFIKKNHKLIDVISISLFLFSLTTLVSIHILNKFEIDVIISAIAAFLTSTIVSIVFTNRINLYLHGLFNLNN